MGYYTNYELGAKENKHKVKDIISYIKEQCEIDDKFYPFTYDLKNYLGDESTYDFEIYGEFSKWYDHDLDMLELSKQFPDTVFYLYGVGEENGDLWYTYYKNGKHQHCPATITYDQYDENKLV